MNRRTFLQLCGFLSVSPFLHLRLPEFEPYDSSGGQWVFDCVNGLTFPVSNIKSKTSRTAIISFRALSFLERLFGGNK